MDVEVEVIREISTTFLVLGAKSLEGAEQRAIECGQADVYGSDCEKLGRSKTKDVYASWSQPVIVREGEILRESQGDY